MQQQRDDRLGFSVISRRRALKLALGAGAIAFAGGGAVLALRRGSPHVAGLTSLTPREFRTIESLAVALFPPLAPGGVGAIDLDLARAFDRFLADEPPWNRTDLERALFLLELGPPLFERRFTTFSRLPEADRLAHFERVWVDGESLLRRQVASAFRKFLSLVFYDEPRVWPHIGYPGPSFHAAAVPAGPV